LTQHGGSSADTLVKMKVAFAAIAAVGTATLNVWFLTDNVSTMERDSSLHYNLTEWVLLLIEAIIVYLCLFAFVYLSVFTPFIKDTPQRADGINTTLAYLSMVGGFSMLLGIKVLTLNKLYQFIKRWKNMVSMVYCHPSQCIERTYEDSAKPPPKEFVVCCFGGCCFPAFPILLIFPLFAPAAFLLKVRQVAFVSTVYFKSWTGYQWLAFFGVVNNVVGLTASEDTSIKSYKRALFGKSEDTEFDHQWKGLELLITECVLERTGSVFTTCLIANYWVNNPDVQYQILKGFSPNY